jgi:chaperone required for assembly of F1-ATPase
VRRNYATATAVPDGPGFAIALDGEPLKTPAGAVMRVPSAALAEAIAEEWNRQDKTVDAKSMPLSQFAATAIDRVSHERQRIVDDLAAYAETDLVCHRAARPLELADRQFRTWQPLLDWLERRHRVRLNATEGIVPAEQAVAAVADVRRILGALDDWGLVSLSIVSQATGSIVIGLAVLDGFLDVERAFAAAALDELYQNERWGTDSKASIRQAAIKRDIADGRRFLELSRRRESERKAVAGRLGEG